MKKQEKELFKSLCSFRSDELDVKLLKSLTPQVLGLLFCNRTAGTAHEKLERLGLLSQVGREERNALAQARESAKIRNAGFFKCVRYVTQVLCGCEGWAMLKGALLCAEYPEGCRTSNDIDLLVRPDAVGEVCGRLRKAGFKQGHVRSGEFVPATRREVLESKLTRGETVPFIKPVGLPQMNWLEVDVNFSLDYKPDKGALVGEMLAHTPVRRAGSLSVRTLGKDDFLIHLCCHFYKEAASMPWVRMGRDMSLYKLGDIYMLLEDSSPKQISRMFERARQLGLEKECAFAALYAESCFNMKNTAAADLARDILADEPDFLHTVVSPAQGKRFVYTERDIEKRLFSSDRAALLEEVSEK